MADATTDVEIRIRATGGSEAADGINKARNAVDNLAHGGAGLENSFGKKLSLIGLNTLNYELLRSIDYGGKAEPVIKTLNMAWFTLASTVGLTNSALFPYIAGITAVVAIVAKLKGGQDAAATSMAEAQKVNVKLSDSYEDAKKGLESYIKVHGTAPAAFKEYVEALREVEKAEKDARGSSLRTQISTLENATKSTSDQIEKLKALNSETKSSIIEHQNFAATQNKVEEGVRDTSAEMVKLNSAYDRTAKEGITANEKKISDLNAKLKDLQLEMKKATTEANGLAGGFASEGKKAEEAGKAIDKHNTELEKLAKNMRDDMISADKEVTEARKKALTERYAYEKSIIGSSVSENEVYNEAIKNGALAAYDTMAKGFGSSVARMLVDGESFKKNINEVFNDILRSFISMVVEMEVRWMAVKFVTSMGLGVPAFATGADMVVDRPTLFMAGENGPERVNVGPMNSAHNDNRRSSNISVSVVNHIGSGDQVNAARLADQIGKQVVARIRGLGDINFTR